MGGLGAACRPFECSGTSGRRRQCDIGRHPPAALAQTLAQTVSGLYTGVLVRLLRPAAIFFLCALGGAALWAGTATSVPSSHGPPLWAGQSNYQYPGVSSGFALSHRTDVDGAELLEQIGGNPPRTDGLLTGAYTIPDEPPPEVPYVDTGRFRGCTVEGDPRRLQGRYESHFDPSGIAGDFDLRSMRPASSGRGRISPTAIPSRTPGPATSTTTSPTARKTPRYLPMATRRPTSPIRAGWAHRRRRARI